MNVLRVFIGYDSREVTAYHVLCDSIMRHTSTPVSITPLIQQTLRNSNLYTRDIDGFASTEFSLTRFLVPALSNYEGYSLFLDCDMLVQTDLTRLFQIAYDRPLHACHVVKHDYTPSTRVKMDHQVQLHYPRKNWSSVMLFNNDRCRILSPRFVNSVAPKTLHRFEWMEDPLIGDLSREWNWLVGEYAPNPDAHLLHYTLGGPWFQGCEFGVEGARWLEAKEKALGC
jgi:hypothetical protein